MGVTSFEELLTLAHPEPEEILIPDWDGTGEITVRVKKPSFYNLLAKNAIANPLIPAVQKLFYKKTAPEDIAHMQPDTARAFLAIAKECLVEPSYEKLTEAGIELTDDQLIYLSVYATRGVEAVRTFRRAIRGAAGKHGEAVPQTAERNAAPERPDDGVVPGRGNRAGANDDPKRRKAEAEKD